MVAVVAGQEIALSAVVNLPDGNSIQNQQWTNGTSLQNPQPPSNAVGGYTNPTGSAPPDTTGGGCIVLIQGQSGSQGQNGACNVTPVSMTNSLFTFYWIAGGSGIQMTYYYTMTNGQSASSTATFNISGPPGASPTGTPGTASVYWAGYADAGAATTPWLEFGAAEAGNVGMSFSASAAPSSGAYLWVQLVGPNSWKYRTNPDTSPLTFGTGLDNFYPYPSETATSTSDSPGIALDIPGKPTEGEAAESFQATMYLLWDPAIPPPGQTSCIVAATTYDVVTQSYVSNPSTCASIPVPLGSVTWSWTADAIKTLDPANTNQGNPVDSWILGCGTGSQRTCGASSGPTAGPSGYYPTWTNAIHNGQTQ